MSLGFSRPTLCDISMAGPVRMPPERETVESRSWPGTPTPAFTQGATGRSGPDSGNGRCFHAGSSVGQRWPKAFPRPRRAPFRVLALALACSCLPHPPAFAQDETPQDKGLGIAREASARNDGFGDFTAGLTMVLRDRHGRESTRQMRFKVLEVPGDGDKSLFVFDQPRDVQGTALLTHSHINTQDDQWLYLPALKRVKRINASKRSGSFMGSEFSYEDMSPPEVEEYTYLITLDSKWHLV